MVIVEEGKAKVAGEEAIAKMVDVVVKAMGVLADV